MSAVHPGMRHLFRDLGVPLSDGSGSRSDVDSEIGQINAEGEGTY